MLHASPHSKHGATALLSVILALVSLLAMAGCGVDVKDQTPPQPPPTPTRSYGPAPEPPNTAETHDLAVTAVDFDPALSPQVLVQGQPVTLLVAVENKGNRKEEQFVVQAQLLSPDGQQVLMSAQKTVSLLSPGDLTVVKFPGATANLPRLGAYLLNVQVRPVARESNTTNNKRSLEIQVH
jgi:CARDB